MGGNNWSQQPDQTKKHDNRRTKNAEFVTHDNLDLSHEKLFNSYQFHGIGLRSE
jgi:hypothetical protein